MPFYFQFLSLEDAVSLCRRLFIIIYFTHYNSCITEYNSKVNAMLPYLSASMGHMQLVDTYYYIHLVPGLLEEMSGFDRIASAA